MTYIRGVWLIWSDCQHEEILYFRRFSCVENRVRQIQNQKYVPLPQNDGFLHYVVTHLRLTSETLKFIESRDSCDRGSTSPVFSVPVQDNKTLPIVVMFKGNWLFCCVPFITDCDDSPASIKCSSAIPVSLTLLSGISKLLHPLPDERILEQAKMVLLDMFLSQSMPFGRPIDVDPLVIQAKLQNKLVTTTPTSKQPAWKPLPYKGRATISLTIAEFVKCAQYGKPDVLDVINVHGNVSCLAALEGVSPEISLSITHKDFKEKLAVGNLLVHPCVSEVDPTIHAAESPSSTFYKLRFMPPIERFTLCDYMVSNIKDVPVYGALKLRENTSMDLFLQLKLHECMKNSFEYFEVNIPFFEREIRHADVKPTWGMTCVSPDKHTIIWNLGDRFPNKTLEASLKATVLFSEDMRPESDLAGVQPDIASFLNYYAQVNFCTKSYLPSCSHIDLKSVHVSPPAKFKFALEKEFATSDYKIWNSRSVASTFIPVS